MSMLEKAAQPTPVADKIERLVREGGVIAAGLYILERPVVIDHIITEGRG